MDRTTRAVLLTLANGLGASTWHEAGRAVLGGFFTGDFAERVTRSPDSPRAIACGCPRSTRAGSTRSAPADLGESPTVSTSDLNVLGNDTNADARDARARNRRRAHHNRNNLRPALDRIATESSTYYMIGYVPIKPFDRSYRSIEGEGAPRRPRDRATRLRNGMHVPD
jgi:hypothetical protein